MSHFISLLFILFCCRSICFNLVSDVEKNPLNRGSGLKRERRTGGRQADRRINRQTGLPKEPCNIFKGAGTFQPIREQFHTISAIEHSVYYFTLYHFTKINRKSSEQVVLWSHKGNKFQNKSLSTLL